MLERTIVELEQLLNQQKSNSTKLKNLLQKILHRIQLKRGDISEIIERHPHLAKEVEQLVKEYTDLSLSPEDLTSGEICLREWVKRVRNCKKKENCLLLDSYNLELGSDH